MSAEFVVIITIRAIEAQLVLQFMGKGWMLQVLVGLAQEKYLGQQLEQEWEVLLDWVGLIRVLDWSFEFAWSQVLLFFDQFLPSASGFCSPFPTGVQ